MSRLVAFYLLDCWFLLQLNLSNLGPRGVFGQVENLLIFTKQNTKIFETRFAFNPSFQLNTGRVN